jgi:hypothetical protein
MVLTPRDLADRMAGRCKPDDGYLRETFPLSQGGLYERRRKLARTARRRDRIHDAAAAQRRLAFRFRSQP